MIKKFNGGFVARVSEKPVVLTDKRGRLIGVYCNVDSASRKVRKLKAAKAAARG